MSWIGGVDHQLDVVPVIVAEDLHGVIARLGHLLAAPLGEPVTGGGGPVAELGGEGLHKALAADVVVEDLVHHRADALEEAPSPKNFWS